MTNLQVLTEGGSNTIFTLQDMDGSTLLAKILKYQREYSDRNYDRVHRDSLQQANSASDHVMETYYSYCGFSQILEYDPAGTLQDFLMRYSVVIRTSYFFCMDDSNGVTFIVDDSSCDGRTLKNDKKNLVRTRLEKIMETSCVPPKNMSREDLQLPALMCGHLEVFLWNWCRGLPVWHGYYNWDARAAIQEGIRLRHERDHQILLLHAIDMCRVYERRQKVDQDWVSLWNT